ncbi:MAG: hypothetical protein HYT35_00140 [Candidatus Staskawiczbacteria bacterium]|nr:hypothetical protein [Candidatus Staskawiczbacteria bacterium]
MKKVKLPQSDIKFTSDEEFLKKELKGLYTDDIKKKNSDFGDEFVRRLNENMTSTKEILEENKEPLFIEKIKKILKDNWFKLSLLIIIVIAIGGAFYWFQLRPIQIRKDCFSRVEKVKNGEVKSDKFNMDEALAREGVQKAIDILYNNCLIEKGLEK